MRRHLLSLLVLGLCACLSGCESLFCLQLFNFTGQELKVLEDRHAPIVIPPGESRTFACYGYHTSDKGYGLLISSPIPADHRWFYSAHSVDALRFWHDRNGQPLATGWAPYSITVGLSGYARRIGVDPQGDLYAIAKGTADIASNRLSQPSGIPIHPQ